MYALLQSIQPVQSIQAMKPTPGMQSVPRLSHAGRVWRLLRAAGLAALLAVAPSAFAVDLNTATPAQLQTIRGIGPKTAQIIVDERNRGGRYQSLEDLSDRVKGIGPKKAAALQAAGLTVQGSATAPAASASNVSAQNADPSQVDKTSQPRRRTR